MKTKIFKSYEDFLNREDRSINGVSKDFAAKHPDFKKQNETNTGCWNCHSCYYCFDCNSCDSCYSCKSCNDCELCNFCHWCESCYECYYCNDCASCYECNHCLACYSCDTCYSCYACRNRECRENCVEIYENEE